MQNTKVKQLLEEGTLTVKDIMSELNLSRAKAYRLASSKQFPILSIGGSVRIPAKGFYEWLDKRIS